MASVNWKDIERFINSQFVTALDKKISKGVALRDFNINPMLLPAIASGIFGSMSSYNMARALILPRMLGTSISTGFGAKMQKFCIEYLGAEASGVDGMDIEFKDMKTKQKLILQLKAGPNTINSGDSKQIIDEIKKAYRLLHTNNSSRKLPTLGVGVLYGTQSELSGHYKNIQKEFIQNGCIPVYTGQDFWLRISGDPRFYTKLQDAFQNAFKKVDYSKKLESSIQKLAKELDTPDVSKK